MDATALEESFTDFVRASAPSLTRTAWLLTGDHALAQDLVQNAYAKTLRAWGRVNASSALAYTRRAVVTGNIDRWRRTRGEVAVGLDFDRPASDRFEDRVADRDRVARMLATLTPTQRRVVVLRYYEDLSEAQTAEALDMTVGAVKAAAHRALAALRSHYPDAAGSPGGAGTDPQKGASR